ncbi:MAG: hypothetical protein IPK50_01285 [Fibrobacterota bacterium]|nr:MAG: hypothetical protein IPK50_01285 [Fibrobacterota bacterium]
MASRYTLWLLILALVLASCQRNPSESKSAAGGGSDSIADTSALQPDATKADSSTQGVVRNRADYSANFLAGLDRATEGRRYVLDRGLLVMEGNDTAYLPSIPTFGRTIRLEREHEGTIVRLDVTRKNWTAVDYRLEVVTPGKKPQVENGTAEIPAAFFLGAESDESESSGESYFVEEYTDTRPDDCTLSLRLGRESQADGALSGRVVVNCPSLKLPDLSEFPALFQK